MRVGLVGASSFLLVAAGVLAATQSRTDSLFTVDQVTESFARHGFALAEPAPELGWGDPAGVFLLTQPIRDARFYVFVSRREAVAEKFMMELTRGGAQTADNFDLRHSNVIVSSDSSFTPRALTRDERARLRAAMDALGGGS
jgi:hypothetical protein